MIRRTGDRSVGYALIGAAVLAYFARPLSCGLSLSLFSPFDPVPYARFDYHGVGVMSAWASALIFAGPVLWLATKVFLNGEASLRVFGRAQNVRWTALSVVVALALGAPMFSQIAYLNGLPISVAAPVAISSVAWMLIVEVGRTVAVEHQLLSPLGVVVAMATAFLAAVPKLLVLIGLI